MTKLGAKDIYIQKVKLVDGNFLEIEYEVQQNILDDNDEIAYTTTNKVKESSTKIIHPDLANAFFRLIPHVPAIAELITVDEQFIEGIETGETFQSPKIASYRCTGFVLGGTEENAGVTLIGRKVLRNKKVINIVTPFTKFAEEDIDGEYPLKYSLETTIGILCGEVRQYLDGKCGLDPQLSLFDKRTEEPTITTDVESLFD